MKMGSKAPGMLAFTGSSASIYPEDYNEAGSLWEHLERNRIDFFNFGFGLEMAPGYEEQAFKYTGVRSSVTITELPRSWNCAALPMKFVPADT